MIQTLFKKELRGFTLIELLVVISIIGLLSTVIAAPIQNARKKAKDAKKLAELDAVRLALDQYAESNNGNYPISLTDLAPQYMPVLPTYALASTSPKVSPVRDRFAYVTYTATPTGSTVSQRFGYHLGVHLDVFSDSLNNDRDCSGASVGVVMAAGSCVLFNTDTPVVFRNHDWVSGSIGVVVGGTGVNSDFIGGKTGAAGVTYVVGDPEEPSDPCTSNLVCVYDVAGQQ